MSDLADLSAKVYYMHDNHTFTQIMGDVYDVVEQARRLAYDSPYGMLGSVRIVDPNDRVVRTVGINIHSRKGFEEQDLLKWRDAVFADAECVWLLAMR